MKIPSVLALVSLASVSVAPIQLNAQTPPAAQAESAPLAEVTAVKFGSARWGGDSWLEIEVEVVAKPGGRSVSGKYLDRVRVSLNLSFEVVDERGAKKNEFYRASAEAVSLEGGRKSTFRFYLPPEVVARDGIRSEVKYYVAEVEVAGQKQALGRGNASTEFKSAESVRNFLSLAGTESGPNDGILVPQHLSPFANDPQRRAPSVFRREVQR